MFGIARVNSIDSNDGGRTQSLTRELIRSLLSFGLLLTMHSTYMLPRGVRKRRPSCIKAIRSAPGEHWSQLRGRCYGLALRPVDETRRTILHKKGSKQAEITFTPTGAILWESNQKHEGAAESGLRPQSMPSHNRIHLRSRVGTSMIAGALFSVYFLVPKLPS